MPKLEKVTKYSQTDLVDSEAVAVRGDEAGAGRVGEVSQHRGGQQGRDPRHVREGRNLPGMN